MSDSKKLIAILLAITFITCGCLAIPAVVGLGMLSYLGARHEAVVEEGMQPPFQIDSPTPEIANTLTLPVEVPSADFGQAVGNKQLAEANMLAAQAELQFAQAQYDAAQGVYEQQRDFNNAQAGRLGAQGIRPQQPMPPDPSLYQAVLAAQQRYDAAKAAYEAAQ